MSDLNILPAYQEDPKPVLITTLVVFYLVALTLPLLFTIDYLFCNGDDTRRTYPEYPDSDSDCSSSFCSRPGLYERRASLDSWDGPCNCNPQPGGIFTLPPGNLGGRPLNPQFGDRGVQLFNPGAGFEHPRTELFGSVPQATQLNVLDSDDDIMNYMDPTDLEFTITIRREVTREYEGGLSGVQEMAAKSAFTIDPSTTQPLQTSNFSDPSSPSMIIDITNLKPPHTKNDPQNRNQIPIQVQPEPLENDEFSGFLDEEPRHPKPQTTQFGPPEVNQPHPLVIARRNQPPAVRPYAFEGELIIKKRPQQPRLTQDVQNQTMTMVSNPRPVTGAPAGRTMLIANITPIPPKSNLKNPEGKRELSKGPKKKCTGKIMVGNSSRFQSGSDVQPKKDRKESPEDSKPSCECPQHAPSGLVTTKFQDLTWPQLMAYAQAEGWYSDHETASDEDGETDQKGSKKNQPKRSKKDDKA